MPAGPVMRKTIEFQIVILRPPLKNRCGNCHSILSSAEVVIHVIVDGTPSVLLADEPIKCSRCQEMMFPYLSFSTESQARTACDNISSAISSEENLSSLRRMPVVEESAYE